jgi:hypothetical protein
VAIRTSRKFQIFGFQIEDFQTVNLATRTTTAEATTAAHGGFHSAIENHRIFNPAQPPAIEGTIEMVSPSLTAVASFCR